MGDQGHGPVMACRITLQHHRLESLTQTPRQGQILWILLTRGGEHPRAPGKQSRNPGFHTGAGRAGHGMAGHKARQTVLQGQQNRALDRAHVHHQRLRRQTLQQLQ